MIPNAWVRAALAAIVVLATPSWAQEAQTDRPAAPSFELLIRAPEEVRSLLERHLDLPRYRELSDLDDAELSRLIRLAERDARQLLGTLGYFNPDIRITREAGARPTVVVTVQPGPATTVQELEIGFEGHIAATSDEDALSQRESILQGWRLPVGQPFTQQRWDEAKAQALRMLTSRRYAAGKISYSLADIDAATSQARLGLRLDSGPEFRLGAMQVSGVRRYDPVLVPRLAHLPQGSVYDRDVIQRAQLRLAGSGYFTSAFILVDPQSDPQAAPVQVTVREAPLQRLVLGLGLTTDAGPRASVEHTHNRVPGIGWRAVTKLQLDRKDPFAQQEWTSIPDEKGWRWSALGRAERLDDDEIVTQARRLRVGRFRSEERIDRNIYVQYDRAKVRLLSGSPLSLQDAGEGSAVSVNYEWTGRYFDHLPLPSTGFGFGFELGGGLTLGSERTPFQRTIARWLGLRPLGDGRLQMRAEAGAVLARSQARVPSTQLFRTGGDTTVRGYGFRDIGVALPGGRIGPGRYLVVGSIEWQRPLRRQGLPSELESVVFVDTGAVADHLAQMRASVGIGGGVRWRSPVGPVEAVIAYGLRAKRARLHFTVGFTF